MTQNLTNQKGDDQIVYSDKIILALEGATAFLELQKLVRECKAKANELHQLSQNKKESNKIFSMYKKLNKISRDLNEMSRPPEDDF